MALARPGPMLHVCDLNLFKYLQALDWVDWAQPSLSHFSPYVLPPRPHPTGVTILQHPTAKRNERNISCHSCLRHPCAAAATTAAADGEGGEG